TADSVLQTGGQRLDRRIKPNEQVGSRRVVESACDERLVGCPPKQCKETYDLDEGLVEQHDVTRGGCVIPGAQQAQYVLTEAHCDRDIAWRQQSNQARSGADVMGQRTRMARDRDHLDQWPAQPVDHGRYPISRCGRSASLRLRWELGRSVAQRQLDVVPSLAQASCERVREGRLARPWGAEQLDDHFARPRTRSE